MSIRARTLFRIVLRFPNLGCLRCITFLHFAAAECRSEKLLRDEDYVTFAGRESLRRVRGANGGVVLAAAGEPLGDVPERFPFDAAAADDDMTPSAGGVAVGWKDRRGDVALQAGTEDVERNANVLLGGKRVACVIERGDLVPAIAIAGHALGQAAPGVASVRRDHDLDGVIGGKRRTQLGRDYFERRRGDECRRKKRPEEAHPPLTHGRKCSTDVLTAETVFGSCA